MGTNLSLYSRSKVVLRDHSSRRRISGLQFFRRKASPVDFVSEMGEIKSKFLQAIKVLGGSAKTVELTYALGEEIFGDAGYSSGQVMQRLQLSGLVERISAKDQKGYGAFKLTRTGEYVASVIDRFLPPPSLSH